MAFNQEQKNQLTLMVDTPDIFLDKCKNKLIYLPGFRNEFFKDGSGIFHILAECIINNKDEKYVEIMKYILNNCEELNLFQQTGRRPSAFSLFLDGLKNNNELSKKITDFLILNTSLTKNEDNMEYYLIGTYISILAEIGEINQLTEVIEKFPKFKKEMSVMQLLFKIIIDKNNIDMLNTILSDSENLSFLKNKIGEFQFNTEPPNHNQKYVNIYSYSTIRNTEEILFKLVDLFGNSINFDGTKKEEFFKDNSLNRIPHPLKITMEKNNKNLFDKFYKKMDITSRAEWLGGNLAFAYEKDYEEELVKDLDCLFTSKEVIDRNKFQIFTQLLYVSSPTKEMEKFKKIEEILEPLWDKVPKMDKAYSFLGAKYLFNNFYSLGNMPNEEINAFINIFKKIKEYEHLEISERTFSNSFFNEPVLAKKLIDAGLDLDKLPTSRFLMEGMKDQSFNIYQIFIELEKQKYNNNNRKIDDLDITKARETLKVIYEANHELIFKKDSKDRNILYLALENANIEIFNLLTIEDLKEIKNRYGDSVLLAFDNIYAINTHKKEKFNVIVDKLLKAEFDFTQTKQSPYISYPIYYQLFDKVSDFNILKNMLSIHNIDINKDIQCEIFWYNLKSDNSIAFLKTIITTEISPENTNRIMRMLSSSDTYADNILNILNVFPNIYKTKLIDNENILHGAIKNQAYKIASILVEKYPDLAIESNKQNKMPISYMINNFAKTIKKSNSYNNYELAKHKKLFQGLIGAGLESPNKKANKVLEEQLEKYKVIEESFPDVMKEYYFKKLQRSLKNDNVKTEIKKLKI